MLIGVYFASCSKEKEMSKMISADRIVLNGTNSDLFYLDADSVEVKLIPVGVNGDEWEVRTVLPMKNTTPWSKIPGSDQSLDRSIYGINFYPKYVDKYDTELELSIETDYQSGLQLLKSDDIITANIPILEYSFVNKDYKKQKAWFEAIDGVTLNIQLSWAEKVSSSSSSSSSSSYNSSSSNRSSKNWNKVLDEYEKFVDQYIKTYKKAMNGDMSAMSDYASLLEKAEDLEDDLADAEDELTTAQMNRYLRITEKLSNALY
jgi:hypothetical protein